LNREGLWRGWRGAEVEGKNAGKNIREDDARGEVVTGLERHFDCVVLNWGEKMEMIRVYGRKEV